MTALAIRTQGLTRDFPTVRAVDSLNLEVPLGGVFGFLGPNGAGKTTTIHLLLGLLKPTAGRVEVLGYDPVAQSYEVRARVGALLEHHGLYESLSAEQNLDLFGRIYRVPPAERRTRVREALESIGLWDRRHEHVGKWSRGMKQKLAIARALFHRPPLVFLDEPTAGHDAPSAIEVRKALRELVRTHGTTVFLTTHNLHEAEELCSRVAVIRQGRLVAAGRPEELAVRTTRPTLEIHGEGFAPAVLKRLARLPGVSECHAANGRLSIVLETDSPAAPIVRLLVKGGASIEEVRRVRPSLEETFIRLLQEEAA